MSPNKPTQRPLRTRVISRLFPCHPARPKARTGGRHRHHTSPGASLNSGQGAQRAGQLDCQRKLSKPLYLVHSPSFVQGNKPARDRLALSRLCLIGSFPQCNYCWASDSSSQKQAGLTQVQYAGEDSPRGRAADSQIIPALLGTSAQKAHVVMEPLRGPWTSPGTHCISTKSEVYKDATYNSFWFTNIYWWLGRDHCALLWKRIKRHALQAHVCSAAQSYLSSVTPWTVAYLAPLSMGFSRWEYWSGLPCPPPEDLPNPGIKPASPALQADSLPLSHPGSPSTAGTCSQTGVWQISPHVYFKSFFLHGFWVLCRDTFWRVCLGNSSKHTLQYFLLKFYRLGLCYVNNTFRGEKKL